jgi:hypothetical protein
MKKNPITEPFISTIVSILTLTNLIARHIPQKIKAYIIYGIGILPFYVYFKRKILKSLFLNKL